jgi:hypothetical protein
MPLRTTDRERIRACQGRGFDPDADPEADPEVGPEVGPEPPDRDVAAGRRSAHHSASVRVSRSPALRLG